MKQKKDLPECPVATTVNLIGSKWKLLIIRNLASRPWRFNELRKSLDGISQKVLTSSLRELEKDGLIYRKDFYTNPPKVEYGLTELGSELEILLNQMAKFGNFYKQKYSQSDGVRNSPSFPSSGRMNVTISETSGWREKKTLTAEVAISHSDERG